MLKKRACFNMIEIALSLMVVAVGLVSVMALVPMASMAANRAVGEDYAADAGDELAHLLAGKLVNNWALIGSLPAENKIPDVTGPFGADAAAGGWAAWEGTEFLAKALSVDPALGGGSSPALRVIKESGAGSLRDFDGIIRVWKSPTAAWEYDAASGTFAASAIDASYSKRAKLNIEVSWPAALPYRARSKAYYSLEVFRRD